MRASATALIRRGIGVKFGTLTYPFSLYPSDLRNVGFQGTRHFSSMLRVDFSCLNDIRFARFLFREMMRVRPPPCVSMFTQLLNAVVKMEEYTTALYMFDEMRQLGGPINLYTMNIAINCYCLVKRVNFGFAMLGCICKLGYEPDAVTFTILVKGLCLNDKVIEAENLFINLLGHNLSVTDEVMISTLINGLCRGGWTSRACDLLEFLERTSCKPNAYAYTTAIDSLCKNGMVEDGVRLFHKMMDTGIMPDAVTYKKIIPVLCVIGRWKDIIDLSIQKINQKISLDVLSFSVLINALCKEGRVKKAGDVVEIMTRLNISPNIIVYNALMDGYCSQGQMEKAKGIFRSLVEHGLEPDIISYNSLIKGYCKTRKVNEAWCLFHEVPRKGLQHTTVTYNTMLHGLFCVGRFNEGWKLFSDMESQQVSDMESQQVCPDIITYRILVKGLCVDGRVAAARDLLHQLPLIGLRPDVPMYTMIFASLLRKGLIEEAKHLLKEMEGNGLKKDEILERLIRERDEVK